VPSRFGDRSIGIEAQGNIVQATGLFSGVQSSYVLTGHSDRSRLNLQFTIRMMDPEGRYQTDSELVPSCGTPPVDRFLTGIALLGEPDPDHPVQLRQTGAAVHELLRAVHTDFDWRGAGRSSLRSTITLGPIVARWRTDVLFNPTEPATAERPMTVRLENIKLEFLDAVTGTLEASITEGRGFAMTFPNVAGPLFRMTGFGPIGPGTGRFRNARGAISMLGAIDLAPAAFSNYYLLHIVDPNGEFRR
jgi:hypothetical protein